jgi:hypothetical protein
VGRIILVGLCVIGVADANTNHLICPVSAVVPKEVIVVVPVMLNVLTGDAPNSVVPAAVRPAVPFRKTCSNRTASPATVPAARLVSL